MGRMWVEGMMRQVEYSCSSEKKIRTALRISPRRPVSVRKALSRSYFCMIASTSDWAVCKPCFSNSCIGWASSKKMRRDRGRPDPAEAKMRMIT